MFEVKILVEDKKLHTLLWSFDGVIVGMPEVIPVRTAGKDPAKEMSLPVLRHQTGSGQTQPERVMKALLDLNVEKLKFSDVSKIAVRLGFSRTVAGAVIAKLTTRGILRKTGHGEYVFNKEVARNG